MKLSDVINQLRVVLPKYTDLFSTVIGIDSISASGGVATITTSSAHGLSNGANITISDVLTRTPIDSVSKDGNVYTFTTSTPHDLTYGWPDHETVSLDGFTDSAWNNSFVVVRVQNRENFNVRSINSLPSLNTNEVLLENRIDGINGRWSATVTGASTFTITGSFDDGVYSGGTISSGQRISGAVEIQRAVEQYTAQNLNDYWMFVVMREAETSKDRSTYSDATATRSASDDMRLRLIDGFSLYVFKNTTQDIAAVSAIDICRHDLLLPILKSVNGIIFPTGLTNNSDFRTIFTGHGAFDYNRAVLIYEYNFESVMDLTNADTVEEEDTRAFRDIDYTEEIGGVDTTDLTVNVDLDEVPL